MIVHNREISSRMLLKDSFARRFQNISRLIYMIMLSFCSIKIKKIK